MKYLLDTNACIRYLNGRSSLIRQKMASHSASDIFICSPVKSEMFYGALRSQMPQPSLAKQQIFFRPFVSLPFDDLAAYICGELRASLSGLGNLIGPYDLQIAAIALANKLTLVTHNTNEFSRVPKLNLEDWGI